MLWYGLVILKPLSVCSGIEQMSNYAENLWSQLSSCWEWRGKIEIQVRERPHESYVVGVGIGKIRISLWFKFHILYT